MPVFIISMEERILLRILSEMSLMMISGTIPLLDGPVDFGSTRNHHDLPLYVSSIDYL